VSFLHFLSLAWAAANEKATEIGWIAHCAKLKRKVGGSEARPRRPKTLPSPASTSLIERPASLRLSATRSVAL
jgi:hypothetical protein